MSLLILLALLQTTPAPDQVKHKYQPPSLTRSVQPDFTACSAHKVVHEFQVLITVGTDGTVTKARLLTSSGDTCFDQAGVAAARAYLAKPGKRDNEPYPTDLYVTFHP